MDSLDMSVKKLPGLNVQAPWARLLLEGQKTIETRTYPLPEKYRGQDLWLIETPGRLGKFKARVIGVIRFSDCMQYGSAVEFYAESDLHLIEARAKDYGWQAGVPKFGWIIVSVKKTTESDAPSRRGDCLLPSIRQAIEVLEFGSRKRHIRRNPVFANKIDGPVTSPNIEGHAGTVGPIEREMRVQW